MFSRKKNQSVLLLHISSGSVTGAFASYEDVKKPKIIKSVKILMDLSGELDISDSSGKVSSAINEILGSLAKHSSKVSGALISFTAPWSQSKTRHINLKEERPFFITKEFLDDISSKEEILFKKELSEDNKSGDLSVVEKSIIHTKINGYVLDQILAKKTKTFEAFLCLSVISKNIAKKILNLTSKHFHLSDDRVIMHTFPVISSSVIRGSFDKDLNFVLLNIGEDMSTLTQVADGVLINTVNFPSGKNSILKQIGTAFSVSKEIAESTLHLYILDKADDETKKTMRMTLDALEKEWSIYFENAMLELSPSMKLPPKFYMTSEGDVSNIFNDFLKIAKTDATGSYREGAKVIYIDKTLLSGLYEVGSSQSNPELLGLMAAFFNMYRKDNFA